MSGLLFCNTGLNEHSQRQDSTLRIEVIESYGTISFSVQLFIHKITRFQDHAIKHTWLIVKCMQLRTGLYERCEISLICRQPDRLSIFHFSSLSFVGKLGFRDESDNF